MAKITIFYIAKLGQLLGHKTITDKAKTKKKHKNRFKHLKKI